MWYYDDESNDEIPKIQRKKKKLWMNETKESKNMHVKGNYITIKGTTTKKT